MKKSLIAGAVALAFAGGAAGVASAQSSTTLYGAVDGGVTHTQFKNGATGAKARLNGFMDGGQTSSRWGIRGSEDLGNGLQAVYVLESGFSLANGSSLQGSRLFGREAIVGLASSEFGRVQFGRQPILAYRWFSNVATPFGIANYQAGAAGTFSPGQTRYDNQIQYQSPSFEGVQFGVGYSFNTNGSSSFKTSTGADPNVKAWTSAVRYGNGPLAAVVTYDSVKDAETATGIRASAWHLAASYDFTVVKVHAGFGANRNGWVGNQRGQLRSRVADGGIGIENIAAFNQGFRSYSYSVGVSAPLDTNSKVLASWGMVDPDKTGTVYAGQDLKSQHIYSLGFNHALSKRTNVYALATYADDLVFGDGNKTRSFGVGLRHNF